jgi:excisionase family DNA binding protein
MISSTVDPNRGVQAGLEAYTVGRFCAAFGVGKTFVYEQIKAKKLRAVKTGARTLILRRDAEAWVDALSPMGDAR